MQWFAEQWALGLPWQIFYCIAIPATVILLIQTILLIFGIGGEDDIDVPDADLPDADGISEYGIMGFFSLKSIVAFFCVFGWSGVVFMNALGSVPIAFLLAFLLGVGAMVGVTKVIRASAKLQQSGTLNMKLLIGESGTIYIPIPEDKTKRGKVTVQLAERQVECDAVSESGAMTANTPVRVTDIIAGNVLVVERIG
ncbi:MAG: NfeD family protein [Oscillospiraceae bacterium]|nr:NfeD family protein [Oscillospiraceae bacterium]